MAAGDAMVDGCIAAACDLACPLAAGAAPEVLSPLWLAVVIGHQAFLVCVRFLLKLVCCAACCATGAARCLHLGRGLSASRAGEYVGVDAVNGSCAGG